MSFLKVAGISRTAIDGLAVNNISFTQRARQKIAIAGETGSGKSTLLKIVAGLLQPDAGGVWLMGERVDGRNVLVPGHPDIAYLGQDFELPRSLRVEQVIDYASQPLTRSVHLAEICKISHVLRRRTNELSGGERQRVAIARLLARAPKLLLLDEPYTNLDRIHKEILKSVINDVGRRLDISCTIISHEPYELLSWPDTLIVLRRGKIVQQGHPKQLYRSPRSAYVASMLGTYTLLNETTTSFDKYFREYGITGNRFVRPESFFLSDAGVPGTIRTIRFLGSYYEVDVDCGDVMVTVFSLDEHLEAGQPVRVALAPLA